MTKCGKPLQVLVTVPLGRSGQGGIDRLMDSVAQELASRPPGAVRVSFQPTRGAGHIAFAPFLLLRFCAIMLARRLSGRLDLVHVNLASHGSTYRKLVIAKLARMLRVPVVIHLHGGGYRSFWEAAHPAMRRQIAKMFCRASRILVLGRVWAEFVSAEMPAAAPQVAILPNAAAIPKLPHRGGGDRPNILFLGRLGPEKGTPELVEALTVIADDQSWSATLAGDGLVEKTRAEIQKAGLAARVRVPGWVGQEAVAQLMSDADILVLPSLKENLPISIIEAMASEVAVIATPVGAVEEIVADGETGLLVQPGDALALATALRKLVTDVALRRQLARRGKRLHRERLAIGPYTDRLTEIWKEAAANVLHPSGS